MVIDGNPPAVIYHSDTLIVENLDINHVTVIGESFVYTVVHHLVHKVMQSFEPGVPDVHRRPFSNRNKAFEDLDVRSTVSCFRHLFFQTLNRHNHSLMGIMSPRKPVSSFPLMTQGLALSK